MHIFKKHLFDLLLKIYSDALDFITDRHFFNKSEITLKIHDGNKNYYLKNSQHF